LGFFLWGKDPKIIETYFLPPNGYFSMWFNSWHRWHRWHRYASSMRLHDTVCVQALDLDGNKLTTIPADIGECTDLEILRLSRNCLRALPATLQHCTRLKLLAVSHNVITCLPPPLAHCSALECIEADHNALVDLPPALGRLTRLRTLDLSGNADLRGVPAEILGKCVMLHTLNLHGTLITREVSNPTGNMEDALNHEKLVCMRCHAKLGSA
jgi:Leucine-rich repeat (LRR) protein